MNINQADVTNSQETKDLIDLTSQIVAKIRHTNTEDEALATGVELVYQALQCDRVVIYTVPPHASGKVVAETVTPGLAQILGTEINDPYFQAEYIDKYQKGRVKIINDIYTEEINPGYRKNLDKIEVKANIILPLVDINGNLYGLLIADQCSQVRQWQQSEINLMLQIADWIMTRIDQERRYQKIEQKLDNFNAWQDSLITITKELYSTNNVSEVLEVTLTKVREVLGCDRVVVYSLQEPTFSQIIAESAIPALAPILGRTIDDPCLKHRYLEKYQEGRVRAINDIYQAGMTPCYIENLEKIGVKSNLVAPINWDDGEIHGLLVAHQCFAFREWDENEIWWIKQVAFQTGLSLSKAKLVEQTNLINSSLVSLENSRDIITITKSQIQEVQQPIQKTAQNLLEILNLNRLLAREINLINQSSSAQLKKETNLIQIISKKLYLNILEMKKNFNLFSDKNQEIIKLLEDTATDLYDSGTKTS